MNYQELVSEINSATEITKIDIDRVLKHLGVCIADELSSNGSIHLHGIGTLSVTETAARKGRNPATGEEIDIPAGKRIKLKAAKVLKDAIA